MNDKYYLCSVDRAGLAAESFMLPTQVRQAVVWQQGKIEIGFSLLTETLSRNKIVECRICTFEHSSLFKNWKMIHGHQVRRIFELISEFRN